MADEDKEQPSPAGERARRHAALQAAVSAALPTADFSRALSRRFDFGNSELSRTLAALGRPHPGWVEMAGRWKALSINTPRVSANFQPILDGWAQLAKSMNDSFASTALRLKPLFDEFQRHEDACQSLERIGYLPHYTTPFDEIGNQGDAQVEEIMARHYIEGWPIIRAAIEDQLATYNVDGIAKAALVEALDDHEAGRFRSAVSLLFTEIERLVRVELHGDGLDSIASVHSLQDLAGEMMPSDISPGGAAGLRLYKRLYKHLYDKVKTEEVRNTLAADPVPNRHAAIHGLLVYDTRQNSLNTIIMADYIFQVISFGRAYCRPPLGGVAAP